MTASGDRVRICVLGSINTDLAVRAPRLPAAGETVLGGEFAVSPGGKGANQAVAAARMGAEVTLVGAVGDDAYGARMLEVLRGEGVDVSRVRVRAGVATGVAAITVSESGENTIVVAPGANGTVGPGDVDAAREAIAAADLVLMQLETPMATVVYAAGLARDLGTTVVLNAAPAARLPMDLVAAADVLVVNESEARIVSAGVMAPIGPAEEPLDELETVLLRAAGLGIATTVMTAGPRGALYAHGREGRGRVDACKIEAVDTVGAGDAFCGALAVRLAEQQVGGGLDRMGIMDAVCWGCAAGAAAAMRRGAIPSLPRRTEVVEMLRRMA